MNEILSWAGANAVSLLSLIVGLSGWGVFIYERITAGPRIKGKVLSVITGQTHSPVNNEKTITIYLTYLYITNLRNSSVHILDYEMEVDFGEGFLKLIRWYGMDNADSYSFFDKERKKIDIPDLQKKLIFKKTDPVQYGQLYKGFILFSGEDLFYDMKVKRFRVTCIDALNKRHKFISTPEESVNMPLLQELAGIILPI